MGYPVQAGAPTTTLNGKMYAIGAFLWHAPIGDFYQIGGIYEQQPDGSWNTVANATDDINTQAHGGINPYITFVVDRAISGLKVLGLSTFSIPITNFPEPIDDSHALIMVQQALASGSFAGAVIPPQMQADWDSYWNLTVVPVSDSRTYGGGSITKMGAAMSLYVSPEGPLTALCPTSDLNVIAKSCTHIAKAWKDAYGFIPQ